MKKYLLCIAAVLFMFTGQVNADPIIGTTYFMTPGLGELTTPGGAFFLSGGGGVLTLDLADETLGPDAAGALVTYSEEIVDLGDGTSNLILTMTSDTGELFPSGLVGGGIPLDVAALFLGDATDPLSFDPGTQVNFVDGTAFDTGGTALFGGDITATLNQDGDDNGTDGDYVVGVQFGAGTTGLGAETFVVTINYGVAAVPEPGTLGLLTIGLVGLAVRRRRS